jgi:hypothetical protein
VEYIDVERELQLKYMGVDLEWIQYLAGQLDHSKRKMLLNRTGFGRDSHHGEKDVHGQNDSE